MAQCDIIPLASAKACSGKCRGTACASAPSVWVLAACEGMAALFEKQNDGHLTPLSLEGSNVSSFADGLRERLVEASQNASFSQLVLVGSANDIAWTQASLPVTVAQQVIAEIEYPLMAGWFNAAAGSTRLTHALEQVFRA